MDSTELVAYSLNFLIWPALHLVYSRDTCPAQSLVGSVFVEMVENIRVVSLFVVFQHIT